MSVSMPTKANAQNDSGKSPWIVNAPVDLLVGCGAWTIPLLLLTGYVNAAGIVTISFVFYFLTVFCNNPHYMATIYRAYGTPRDFRKYKLFTVYLTVVLLATAVGTHFAPLLLPILFTVYLTWSPWHYTGQNFGIAMMFARRSGATPSRGERNLIYTAYVASYIVWFLNLHSTLAENPYVLTLGIPQNFALWASVVCFAVFFACSGVAHVGLVSRVGLRAMTPMLLLLLTQFLWFLFPVFLHLGNVYTAAPIYYSTGVLAFMHCAQYLWITGYYAKREAESGIRPTWKPVKYYVAIVLGGIALFVPGPWLVSRVFRYNLIDSYLIFVALINIHHFMLDGAIWKLRDGRIARLLLGSGGKDNEIQDDSPGFGDRFFRWIGGPGFTSRTIRYGFLGGLVAIAVVDQAQYFHTLEGTGAEKLRRALSINPSDNRSHRQLARELIQEGRPEEAERVLREAIALRGINAEEKRMLATLLVSEKRYAEAEALYTELDSVVRPDVDTLLNRGVILITERKYAEATRNLEAAVALDPDRADAWFNLGELRFESGEYEGAADAYDRYMSLGDMESPTGKMALAALKLAECETRLGNTETNSKAFAIAAGMAEKAKASEVQSHALGRLGETLFADGEVVRARRATVAAIRAAQVTENDGLLSVYLYNLATYEDDPNIAAALLHLTIERSGDSMLKSTAEEALADIDAKFPGSGERGIVDKDKIWNDLIGTSDTQ